MQGLEVPLQQVLLYEIGPPSQPKSQEFVSKLISLEN